MNKVILSGRLTKDPIVTHGGSDGKLVTAKFTLAVEKRSKDQNGSADFINIIAFSKAGEFAEKYLKKGMKIMLEGRIITGSYMGKDNHTVYTTDVCADTFEFCESKSAIKTEEPTTDLPMNMGFAPVTPKDNMPFMNIPSGMDQDLPFAPVSR